MNTQSQRKKRCYAPPGRQYSHADYEDEKRLFQANNPGASDREYNRFIKKLTRKMGL